MTQRKRLNGGFRPSLIAAEVLETRALLSAGAAAVHAATHHLALHHAAGPAAESRPLATTHLQLGCAIFINEGGGQGVSGTVSFSKVTQALGAKFTAHFTFASKVFDGKQTLIKGTYVGTVSQIQPVGGGTVLNITPTGGSITMTVKTAGSRPEKATAIPSDATIDLTLNSDNTFSTLGTTDVFKPGSPAGLSGETIRILIGAK